MTEQTCTAEALNDLRQRYLRGEEWSRQELKDAIYTMIGQRIADIQASVTPAKKVKAAPVSLDSLLPGVEPTQVPKATEQSIPLGLLPTKPKTKQPLSSERQLLESAKNLTRKKSTDGFF